MSDRDEDLVRKAQTGDRAAFGELVRRTSRLLYARLYLDTGDRHFAEDLVQETWLLAYRGLAKLTNVASLRPWLLAIAQNVLAEAKRRQGRLKRTPPARVAAHVLTEIPGTERTPIEEVELADTHDRVLQVLRSLPEEYRSALSLRYVVGADYETIETQLGLTNGALRGLLHRGLKILRARLEGMNGTED